MHASRAAAACNTPSPSDGGALAAELAEAQSELATVRAELGGKAALVTRLRQEVGRGSSFLGDREAHLEILQRAASS